MVNRLASQLKTSAATVAIASGLLFSTAAVADQVTLKSADGTVNLVGDFIDFKDDNYIIRTALAIFVSAQAVYVVKARPARASTTSPPMWLSLGRTPSALA